MTFCEKCKKQTETTVFQEQGEMFGINKDGNGKLYNASKWMNVCDECGLIKSTFITNCEYFNENGKHIIPNENY